MSEHILRVKKIKKYFPIYSGVLRHQTGVVKAVDGVDFELGKGEVLGIVGESGSGKSTLARAVMRLIEPSDGSVEFMGQDFLALGRNELLKAREQMQMVFQDPYSSLNPRKSVGESIAEPLLYHRMAKTREEAFEKVADVLERVGLSPAVAGRYPHQFSGGQQQRICIGRAIAMQPSLLVLDESVSALDVSVQAQILNLLHSLKEQLGLSYLFISHDLSVVQHICDRVLVMYKGKEMECNTVQALFENPQHEYTQALLSAVPCQHPSQRREPVGPRD